MVITVEQRHIEIGSERGRQFYQEHSDIIEKFVEFCQRKCLQISLIVRIYLSRVMRKVAFAYAKAKP